MGKGKGGSNDMHPGGHLGLLRSPSMGGVLLPDITKVGVMFDVTLPWVPEVFLARGGRKYFASLRRHKSVGNSKPRRKILW